MEKKERCVHEGEELEESKGKGQGQYEECLGKGRRASATHTDPLLLQERKRRETSQEQYIERETLRSSHLELHHPLGSGPGLGSGVLVVLENAWEGEGGGRRRRSARARRKDVRRKGSIVELDTNVVVGSSGGGGEGSGEGERLSPRREETKREGEESQQTTDGEGGRRERGSKLTWRSASSWFQRAWPCRETSCCRLGRPWKAFYRSRIKKERRRQERNEVSDRKEGLARLHSTFLRSLCCAGGEG